MFQAYNMEETMAVSSQVMNRNNYRIILEEILKFGNIKRSTMPKNIDDLPPAEQVSILFYHSSISGRQIKFIFLYHSSLLQLLSHWTIWLHDHMHPIPWQLKILKKKYKITKLLN